MGLKGIVMAIVCTAEATRAAEQRWFDTHPGQDRTLMRISAPTRLGELA